jgi:hypothetical protein
MPSESKRLARLIPSDILEAVSNPSFPNRAYTFQRTSALYGVFLEAHRPHVSVMHLPCSHSGTHTSVLSHLGQASIFGEGVSPLPVPGYLSGPSCRGFQPLAAVAFSVAFVLCFEFPLSIFASINCFKLHQDYYMDSATPCKHWPIWGPYILHDVSRVCRFIRIHPS